jgi:protein-disulfide isomerase
MKNIKRTYTFIFALLFVFAAFAFSACNPAGANNKNTAGTNKNANTQNAAQLYASAPQGANPPWSKGAPNAAVVIEEFADFQCPTCGQMHPKVQEIRSAYGDRVKIIYREFPLPMHQHGYDAALAAEAAGQQGKFWDMENLLFTNQSAWSTASDARKIFEEYAEKIGLDAKKFSDDMVALPTKNRVDADMQRGKALQVGSTPTFFMNGRMLPFEEITDVNNFRKLIDAELAKSAGNTGAPPSNPASPQSTNAPANSNTSK